MRTKFRGILTLLLAFVVQLTFAQEKTVTGTVVDGDGLPIPGVDVFIKNTTTGIQTDFDGNYSLEASSGQTLVFSYVGYRTQEIRVGSKTTIDVTMRMGEQLSEVVVTAYGTTDRNKLSSAVSVVSNEEITRLNPTTSLDNALQGLASGVSVTAGNGKPGQTAFVRIRGIGSINASSAPLYIIDGIVAPNLNTVNLNDVENISVLKDAATASKYGSRAANGVIIITTKTGSKGKQATIEVNSRFGYVRKIDDNFDMMNAAQKIRYERELSSLGVSAANGLPGAVASQEDYERLLSFNNDWQETLLRDGVVKNNNFSISGGDEKFTYFFSASHDTNEGIIRDISGFERTSGRLNITYQAKDWLNVGANVNVISTHSDEPRDRNNVQNPFRAMYDYNPYETKFLRDANGDIVLDDTGQPAFNPTRAGFSISEALVNNPEDEFRTTINAGLNADIDFGGGFQNTFRIGATNQRFRREYFVKPGSILDDIVGDAENPGSKTDGGSNLLDYTVTNIFSFSKTFDEVHNFKLSALAEFNRVEFRDYSLTSIGFGSSFLSVQDVAAQPTAATTNFTESSLMSYGGFLDYSYDDRFVATASIRRDESSNFGVNSKYGVFWSGSAAWNIHNEKFMEDVDFINTLKLRTSAGTSGNRAGIGDFASLATIGFGSLGGATTAIPTDNGNPDLGFEENFIFDIGVEFGMFQNRLRGVIDYYNRTTSDLLLNRPLLALGGEPDGEVLSNIGEMENRGVEVEISGDIVATQDWRVTLGGNFTYLENEVTKLVGTPNNPDGTPINRDLTTIRVGEEINTFFMPRWAGVNPANGEPLFYDAEGNITNVYNADANEVLSGKSRIPDYEGGVNLTVVYKGFDLNADFYYRFGSYVYNFMESNMLSDGTLVNANQRLDAFNYWRNPGDTNVLPSPLFGVEAQQFSDRFLQKGDLIRLRNLTLGYNLSDDFLKNLPINKFRIFVQGQNLWSYIPEFKGDPEVGIGSGETDNIDGFGTFNLYSYPITQSFSLGVDIEF
jgi:TonB-linked SusC/RagA family outer membrane protein